MKITREDHSGFKAPWGDTTIEQDAEETRREPQTNWPEALEAVAFWAVIALFVWLAMQS